MKGLTVSRYFISFCILFVVGCGVIQAQTLPWDSIKTELKNHPDDTTKVILWNSLSFRNAGVDADTVYHYSQQALSLAKKLNYEEGMFWSEITLSGSLAVLGNYPISLDHGFSAMSLAKKSNKPLHLAFANGNLAECYLFMGDYPSSLKYERECLRIVKRSGFNDKSYYMWIHLSRAFEAMHQVDSALIYARNAFGNIKETQNEYAECYASSVLGDAYAANQKYDSAIYSYYNGIRLSLRFGIETDLIDNYNGLSTVYKLMGLPDSSLIYARKIVLNRVKNTYPAGMLKAANLMADIYADTNNSDSTLKYLRIAIALKDTLFSREKTIAMQNLTYKEEDRIKELNVVRDKARTQVMIYTSVVIMIAFSVFLFIFIRNRRDRQLQQIRNAIADDLHDDIGSTLSSIGIMSELAKGKSPEAFILLNSIGESTAVMQENMSDIIWAIKADGDNFDSLLSRMNQFGSEILNAKGIEFNFEPEALPDVDMTIHQRKNLFLFYKEVINNAAKYSEAKKLSVSLRKDGRRIQMTIHDDGIGFDVNASPTGNGMNTLKKRASELNAEYHMQSSSETGTTVLLRFKI